MAKAKKTEKPVEAVVVEPVVTKPERSKTRVHSGSIFWGFAFIFAGVLLLLGNLNIITVNFDNLVQLWPVLIVGTGISMLSLRGWLGGIVSVLLALLLGALVYLVAVENPFYDVNSGFKQQQTNHFLDIKGFRIDR